VQSCHQAKGFYLEESKIYLDLLNPFWGYYMIPYVLFYSFDVLFYNVENSKNKENPLNEQVCPDS
jgi:hypothetical protein